MIQLPDLATAAVVVSAPGEGPGHWSGAASAVRVGESVYLCYRSRRPLVEGRGVGVFVESSRDGVHFEKRCHVARELLGAESFEKPCLVPLAEGRWRLYLSCATPNSKHWWVEALTADTVEGLPEGERAMVFPGDDEWGVKDPVIVRDGDAWDCWLCCHPLDVPEHEDRMFTRHLTSSDGLTWTDHGIVLQGRPGQWDARGARVTALLSREPLTLAYDGRPDAASNWYETMGVVVEHAGVLERVEGLRLASPESDGAARYATVVDEPRGGRRWYLEVARPDGAHDLVTVLTS